MGIIGSENNKWRARSCLAIAHSVAGGDMRLERDCLIRSSQIYAVGFESHRRILSS